MHLRVLSSPPPRRPPSQSGRCSCDATHTTAEKRPRKVIAGGSDWQRLAAVGSATVRGHGRRGHLQFASGPLPQQQSSLGCAVLDVVRGTLSWPVHIVLGTYNCALYGRWSLAPREQTPPCWGKCRLNRVVQAELRMVGGGAARRTRRGQQRSSDQQGPEQDLQQETLNRQKESSTSTGTTKGAQSSQVKSSQAEHRLGKSTRSQHPSSELIPKQ